MPPQTKISGEGRLCHPDIDRGAMACHSGGSTRTGNCLLSVQVHSRLPSRNTREGRSNLLALRSYQRSPKRNSLPQMVRARRDFEQYCFGKLGRNGSACLVTLTRYCQCLQCHPRFKVTSPGYWLPKKFLTPPHSLHPLYVLRIPNPRESVFGREHVHSPPSLMHWEERAGLPNEPQEVHQERGTKPRAHTSAP